MASCKERGANIQAWQNASYKDAQQAEKTCDVTLQMVGSLYFLYREWQVLQDTLRAPLQP